MEVQHRPRNLCGEFRCRGHRPQHFHFRLISSDGQPILAAREARGVLGFRPPGRYRLPGVLVRLPTVPALLLRKLAGILFCGHGGLLVFPSSPPGNWAAALNPTTTPKIAAGIGSFNHSIIAAGNLRARYLPSARPPPTSACRPPRLSSSCSSVAYFSPFSPGIWWCGGSRTSWPIPPAGSSIICAPLTCAAVFHPSCRSPVWRWGACLWALCSFRRLRLIDILRATETAEKPHSWLSFLSLEVRSFSGVRELENSIKRILESSSVISLGRYASLMALGLLVGHYFFATRLVRALEPPSFYWLFEAAFIIVYWALLMEFFRLVYAWRSLHLLLQRLSWHPLLAAFKRYRGLPAPLGQNESYPPAFNLCGIGVLGGPGGPPAAHGQKAGAGAWHRRGPAENVAAIDSGMGSAGSNRRHRSFAKLCGYNGRTIPGPKRPYPWIRRARNAPAASKAIGGNPSSPDATPTTPCSASCNQSENRWKGYWSPSPTEGAPSTPAPDAREFFDQVEEFIVSRLVNFLAVVFPSLQNLGFFVLAGLLLMLLAVTSYPFQPRNEFLFFNWVVILIFIGTVFWIFVQMERDTVLSLLNDTNPGQIHFSRELVLRILLYVAVPLLALLGAQFPESVQQILSLFASTQGSP